MEAEVAINPDLHLNNVKLSDIFLEEVGELKLDIQKVRSRVAIIRAFYDHLRKTKDLNVRRELFQKIDTETDDVAAALNKISDIYNRWPSSEKWHISDMLIQAVDEYRAVLENEKQSSTELLQSALKEASRREPPRDDAELGSTAYLPVTTIDQDLQFEIEERYRQILRANSTLQRLCSMFPQHLQFTDSDYSGKDVADLILESQNLQNIHIGRPITRKNVLLVGVASVFITTLVIILMML